MFLDSWSIALVICSIVVVFLMCFAARSAVRVLCFWDPASDTTRQIKLENEIWLTSTLVEYALAVQILSLIIFVLAADHFSQSIAGAMCATGSLLANKCGIPALLVKIGGVFFYGFWIVLHQLDIQSEEYPLVRIKYFLLLLLCPLLIVDIVLVMTYIGGLQPDIITSCCGVIFGDTAGGETNLLTGFSHNMSLGLFYGTVAILAIVGIFLIIRWQRFTGIFSGVCWFLFFPLALMIVTTEFTPYMYAMPFHKCPFCILQPEYNYIGFFVYASLFVGSFFGMAAPVIYPLRKKGGLSDVVPRFQRTAVIVSLIMLMLFVAFSSYHYVMYMISGGEG